MITPKGRPGFGDNAVITNPVTGKEWIIEVRYWGTTGCPFGMDLMTAERRWFPPHWITELERGVGPRDCSCRYYDPESKDRVPDLYCDVHISEQRRKELTK